MLFYEFRYNEETGDSILYKYKIADKTLAHHIATYSFVCLNNNDFKNFEFIEGNNKWFNNLKSFFNNTSFHTAYDQERFLLMCIGGDIYFDNYDDKRAQLNTCKIIISNSYFKNNETEEEKIKIIKELLFNKTLEQEMKKF